MVQLLALKALKCARKLKFRAPGPAVSAGVAEPWPSQGAGFQSRPGAPGGGERGRRPGQVAAGRARGASSERSSQAY
jgi:hypothetical protein